jgi:glutamate racemase
MLIERGVKALVIACNTASAYGLEHLRALHPNVPIFGVIDPVAQRAAKQSPTGAIAVIGTRGTVASGCYPAAITTYAPHANIVQLPCPLFVPLAEERWTTGPVVEAIARSYFQPLVNHKIQIDTMILGCTHYPILRDALGLVLDELMPRHVTLLDSAQATTARLVAHLNEHDLHHAA